LEGQSLEKVLHHTKNTETFCIELAGRQWLQAASGYGAGFESCSWKLEACSCPLSERPKQNPNCFRNWGFGI
jgi:hypothetical protein